MLPNGDIRLDPVHPSLRFSGRPATGWRAGDSSDIQWYLGDSWIDFPAIAKAILIERFDQQHSWIRPANSGPSFAAPLLPATPPRSRHPATTFANLCFGEITPELLPLSGFRGRRDLRDNFGSILGNIL